MADEQGSAVIYVVSADAGVRDGISRLLRSAGFTARAGGAIAPVLAEAAQVQRGCVLLDITLFPAGVTALHAARLRDGSGLPLIALSARDDPDVRDQARDLGSRFFMSMPVDDRALLDAIHWVMDTMTKGASTE